MTEKEINKIKRIVQQQQQLLDELDGKRQKIRKKYRLLNIVSFLAVVILVVPSGILDFLLKTDVEESLLNWWRNIESRRDEEMWKEIERPYKKKILPKLIRVIITDATYFLTKITPKEIIKMSELFLVDNANNNKTEDYVECKIEGIQTCFFETELNNKNIVRGEKVVENIFKGQFYIFEFNRKIESEVIVTTKIKNLNSNIPMQYKRITLEDNEFNKMFNIYSNDNINARYILSPVLMEKLKEIRSLPHINELHVSFIGTKIYLALSTDADYFKLDMKKSLCNEEVHLNFVKEMCVARDFIHTLKLNENIWLK